MRVNFFYQDARDEHNQNGWINNRKSLLDYCIDLIAYVA